MEEQVNLIRSKIRDYPDFPKKGIIFKDLFAVLSDVDGLRAIMSVVRSKAAELKGKIDCVVALDSRGFLFGPIMALEAEVPFVPVRKKGKLPGEVISQTFTLEYGEATFEIQKDALPKTSGCRCVIVDDLLATGGTMKAACNLVTKLGGEVVHCFVIMELGFLEGRAKVGHPVESLIKI